YRGLRKRNPVAIQIRQRLGHRFSLSHWERAGEWAPYRRVLKTLTLTLSHREREPGITSRLPRPQPAESSVRATHATGHIPAFDSEYRANRDRRHCRACCRLGC